MINFLETENIDRFFMGKDKIQKRGAYTPAPNIQR